MKPVNILEHRIKAARLTRDEGQIAAAKALTGLHERLARWRIRDGWVRHKTQPPKGLYLWGGVGRGKSMLMDIFFRTAPVAKKRRVHFHEFMQETHGRIGDWRKRLERKRGQDDPIPPVAKAIAAEARLLCFDEFQVADIADAMLLGRLFEHLFDIGVVVVATSNRAPDDLYRDGINRQLFLPFIAELKSRLDVMEIASGIDHRLQQLTAAPVYYTPLGPEAEAALEDAWNRLTQGAEPRSCTLTVQGRALRVPREAAGVARFTFEELCARPLGAADYLALASQFHTLLAGDVPQLKPEKRNEAKRFVTLIDALYEAKTKLIMSAAAEPDDLYPAGDGAFEFERTASRLMEMRSESYLAAAHEEAMPEANASSSSGSTG
ncbi:MAG: cell division protein ZapE [Rhodobacterales bacterium CG15_BIG_FIL_POST_REV_8_21_14_020_59_13]|nr:MAG: cell division protein ZapE [Rhodobacterales bacterium CG15_BIG_FIL_POST_REV_8_21_14_020_59_13]